MVETLASYLAMIKQRKKKSEYISNPNWRDLGIFDAIIFFFFLDIKIQKAWERKTSILEKLSQQILT